MRLRILLFSLVLMGVATSTVAAQTGRERDQHRRRGSDAGPVPELLRHRTELRLSDDQVRRLQEIDAKMEEQNRPYVAQLLQIRRDMQVRPGVRPEKMTEAERAEFQRHLEEARPLWNQIRKNNHAAMREVGGVLDEEQKALLRKLLRKPREQNGSPGPERPRTGRGI